MLWILATVVMLAVGVVIFALIKRKRDRDEIERHSITPEDLRSLLTSNPGLLVFDVRQPLDLLAYPEIIPRAQRIPPAEVLQKPAMIPREKEAVVYCTCPSDKTSRAVLRRALDLDFVHIKFLRGGLAAWKEKGYPVDPYQEVFNLYSSSSAQF